jgi:hypothetical protein
VAVDPPRVDLGHGFSGDPRTPKRSDHDLQTQIPQ